MILAALERRRLLNSDLNLGSSIEGQIMDRELAELAAVACIDKNLEQEC